MPTKKSETGKQYRIDGKKFIWTVDVDEDQDPVEITIPLRIKLGVIRSVGADADMSASTMFLMLEKMAPGQGDKLDEMDLNDFQDMFTTWQDEYEKMSGATLGESTGSST